jgi:hypothetical protein
MMVVDAVGVSDLEVVMCNTIHLPFDRCASVALQIYKEGEKEQENKLDKKRTRMGHVAGLDDVVNDNGRLAVGRIL